MTQASPAQLLLGRQMVISHDCGGCHGGGTNPANAGWLAGRMGPEQDFKIGPCAVSPGAMPCFVTRPRNLTPDKLRNSEVAPLFAACDAHLVQVVKAVSAEWVIGLGGFAAARARQALADTGVSVGRILHPSPASPAANRGWAPLALRQMQELGLWK